MLKNNGSIQQSLMAGCDKLVLTYQCHLISHTNGALRWEFGALSWLAYSSAKQNYYTQ
jgi:hypothetical protein